MDRLIFICSMVPYHRNLSNTQNADDYLEREYEVGTSLVRNERKIYLLIKEKAMTFSEIVQLVLLERSEVYRLLLALQKKHLVMASPKDPVEFIGCKN